MLPGMFPFEMSGTVIVCFILLMFEASFVWHVSQPKAPYLPPATPQPPSPLHLADPVLIELWRREFVGEDEVALTVVVTGTSAGDT